MIFRARKSVRLLAAAGAAATPSFGVGASRAAAAAPITTPPECGMTYDPSLHTVGALDTCGVKVRPFAGLSGRPGGAARYSYRSAAGVLATIEVPAA